MRSVNWSNVQKTPPLPARAGTSPSTSFWGVQGSARRADVRHGREHIVSVALRDAEPSPRRLPGPGAWRGHLPPGYAHAEREALPGH